MGILIALIVGGLAGWLASIVMGREGNQGLILNIVVGILGAAIANFAVAPLVGIPADITTLNIQGFLLAFVGAVILLAIVNLATRGRVR